MCHHVQVTFGSLTSVRAEDLVYRHRSMRIVDGCHTSSPSQSSQASKQPLMLNEMVRLLA